MLTNYYSKGNQSTEGTGVVRYIQSSREEWDNAIAMDNLDMELCDWVPVLTVEDKCSDE